MSDTPTGPVPREQLRASDADRNATAEKLQKAVSEGRLTLEEFTSRTSAAYAAVTLGDLAQLTIDLPNVNPPRATEASALQPYSPNIDAEPYRGKRKFVSVMGESVEHLHGVLPKRLKTVCVMGDLTIDLRNAVIGDDVVIKGSVVMGDTRIIVPDGVTVINEGAQVMGTAKIRVKAGGGGGGPTLRIDIATVMGDLRVSDASYYKERRRGPWHRWMGDN